MRKYIIVFAR